MRPKAVQRLATGVFCALLLIGVAADGLNAQATTGKIQGRVTSTDGQAIPAAQVTIEGTTLGNITNDEGFYFINEVPAGLVNVRAQSIGYRAVVVSEQRVLAGQTLTLNFQLEQTAVELEAIIVTGERNPLVPRDQVSSKAIVTGEQIDQLPLDNANSIILLQPGVISTNSGRTIRGSRPGEEAVYIDGVPVRRLRTGSTESVELPTNVLAQVDVTTGGISARYADAQSGVINYVTRTGGADFGGTASLFTDMLGPVNWSTGLNRAELSLGGPIPIMDNLTFFVGGTAEGRKYSSLNQGMVDNPGFWVATGVDTTFTLARTSAVSGMADSVTVDVPNYVRWDNGNRVPGNVSDEYNLTAKVSYGLPRGGKVDLTYYRNRDQSVSRGFGLYNPQNYRGNLSTENMLTLGTYFLIAQSAERQLALDLKASYQRDWGQAGDVEQGWLRSHTDPMFGFNFSSVDFLLNPDDWPVSDLLVDLSRSGILPAESLQVLPGRGDLTTRQGVAGVNTPLRLNPYGMRSGWSTSGIGNSGQTFAEEKRWYFSGTADWQVNRYNRLWFGGDITMADTEIQNVPLYDGRSLPEKNSPTRGSLYVQDRLDIGDVVLEGGLRWEYFDPDGVLPRIPGYVFNVPDSLKADFVRLEPGTGPLADRVVPNSDCGGDLTAPERRRADGTLVCKNNFIPIESRTTFSPRLAVSFPVTATSTFRFSYSHNTQVPALTVTGGIVDDIYNDLQGGLANTNTTYGRDVEIPRTVLFEAGYRQVFGGTTVIDVAAYSKTTRNSLTYRKLPFEDPNNRGQTVFLNVLTNADYSLSRGLDVRFDRRFSEIADLSINYSFVDARGTGSDPNTYTGLILRRNTNLSITTGQPVDPPELLLLLNQSRAHNVAGTFSMLFPSDYMEGSAAGTILQDLGIFATMRLASGLPYTRLQNDGAGQQGPPTLAGLGGIPAEELNASRTPGFKSLDLRIHRGFRLGDNRMRVFADFRNPLHIANTTRIWLETGEVNNAVHREQAIDGLLRDATLDGDPNIDDFDIMAESPDNALNKYMLMQAESRFGNGDGFFTVDEQRAAFLANYNLFNGALPDGLRTANRFLRFGLEFVF